MNRSLLVGLSCAGLLALLPLANAAAIETRGTVAVVDVCYDRIVAMAPDGANRLTLPYIGDYVTMLDVSRGAPLVSILAGGRVDPNDPTSERALYVLDPTEASAPVRLATPPGTVGNASAAFSPGAARLAWVNEYQDAAGVHHDDLWIADLVADAASGRPASLANPVRLADLLGIGQRSDSAASGAQTGPLDFAPDGKRLVVMIYDDLWLLQLGADGQSLDLTHSRNLTRTTTVIEGAPAWGPAGSAAGDTIALSGGPISQVAPGLWGLAYRDMNISTISLATGTMHQVTTKANTASANDGREHPDWSANGSWLMFDAQGAPGKRVAPCGSLVDYDLFQIPWDGSAKSVVVTGTAGTSVERSPGWGW